MMHRKIALAAAVIGALAVGLCAPSTTYAAGTARAATVVSKHHHKKGKHAKANGKAGKHAKKHHHKK